MNQLMRSRQQELTPKQKRFVAEFMRNGGRQAQAAERAGYASGAALTQKASRLVRNPLIQQAIIEETRGRDRDQCGTRTEADRDFGSMTARSDYVKLEAAKDLLDRAGLGAPERGERASQSLTVSFDISPRAGWGGGSENGEQATVTRPHTGKSDEKLLEHVAFSKTSEENDGTEGAGSAGR